MKDLLNKIFDFLEQKMPGLLVAFGLGYRLAKKKDHADKVKIEQLELENDLLKNKEIVRHKFDGMSDADVINEFLSTGSDDKPDPGKD